jgi:hypothetical protein
LRRVEISVRTADVPSAASVNVVVTAPNGVKTNFPCSSEPCAISVDERQGQHIYQIQYFSSTGVILTQSQPEVVTLQ